MKLAVSSIAWTNQEDPEIALLLQKLGVKYIEIAPTKLWDDPTQALPSEIEKYVKFWRAYGIEIVAFQSMLFNRPDLKIFGGHQNRLETLKYLKGFIRLAGNMGAGKMVFGSPKNRQCGSLANNNVAQIAQDFFNELGNTGQKNQVCFCIEPNPTDYGCDFITNAHEGIDLVRTVNNEGFGLHLDIAGMTLAKDKIRDSIINSKNHLRHFHISSPFLDQVEAREDVHHEEAAIALRTINYSGYVSIEMRPVEVGKNAVRVEKAVKFAQKTYGV